MSVTRYLHCLTGTARILLWTTEAQSGSYSAAEGIRTKDSSFPESFRIFKRLTLR